MEEANARGANFVTLFDNFGREGTAYRVGRGWSLKRPKNFIPNEGTPAEAGATAPNASDTAYRAERLTAGDPSAPRVAYPEELRGKTQWAENSATGTPPKTAEIIREYETAADPKIIEFLQRNKGNNKAYYEVGEVSERQVKGLKNLTGHDYNGYEIDLASHAGTHVDNRHGIKGEANHTMANPDDLARVKYVLDNFDEMELSGKSGQYLNSDGTHADVVRITKKVNGYYHVVEAVPYSKKKVLRIISAYKSKRSVGVLDAETQNAQLASNRTDAASFNNNVSQPSPEVNASAKTPTRTAGAGLLSGGIPDVAISPSLRAKRSNPEPTLCHEDGKYVGKYDVSTGLPRHFVPRNDKDRAPSGQ